MLASCFAGWQVQIVLWRQHNQPLWRKESFTPLNGNLSCQLRGFVDEIQGELQPICLGWENEGCGLRRRGCRQAEKERAVCKQLSFGRHELEAILSLKTNWNFWKDKEKILTLHLLLHYQALGAEYRTVFLKSHVPITYVSETSLNLCPVHSLLVIMTLFWHLQTQVWNKIQHQGRLISSVGVGGKGEPQNTEVAHQIFHHQLEQSEISFRDFKCVHGTYLEKIPIFDSLTPKKVGF